MGDGTEEYPYTCEDVIRLIKKNGGKAEGLNLSGKYFGEYFSEIDLRHLDFEGIIFYKLIIFLK